MYVKRREQILIVKMSAFLVTVLLAGTFFASSVEARTISLAWDASPEADIVGYKLYYKSDSTVAPFNGTGALEGPSPIILGNSTSASLSGLPDDRALSFTVTAYNSSGQESTYSNIVTSDAIVATDSSGIDTGNNLGDSSNNAPTNSEDAAGSIGNTWQPLLWYPANGAVTESIPVQIDWEPLPSGSQATFTLYYGTDPYLGANSMAANAFNTLANPTLLAGVFVFGGVGLATRRSRLLLMLMLALLAAGPLLSGCGGGGGGGSSDSATPVSVGDSTSTPLPGTSSVQVIQGLEDNTYTVGDLQSGTTYYWKVVAVDGQTQVESDIYSFTTQAK